MGNLYNKINVYIREKRLLNEAKKYDKNKFENTINFNKSNYACSIQKYNNKHRGERCFILGNGPSLNINDLNTLYENNEITFATNRIYKVFPNTRWRPTYYCCEDPLIIKEKQDEINAIKSEEKFIPINLKWYHGVNIKNSCKFYLNYNRNDEEKFSFSTDISQQINCRGTVTFTCMQIAVYMGFSEIYLLGVDHNYKRIIDENGKIIEDNSVNDYFCEGYDDDIKDIVVHDMGQNTRAYEDAKRFCEQKGNIKIYNATRGGRLEVFERIDFDSLF